MNGSFMARRFWEGFRRAQSFASTRTLHSLGLHLAVLSGVMGLAFSTESLGQDASASGQSASELEQLKPQWYDSETGSLRPVEVQGLQDVDSSTRVNGWVEDTTVTPNNSNWNFFEWLFGNGSGGNGGGAAGFSSAINLMLNVLLWVALIAIAIGLFSLVFFVIFRKGDKKKGKLGFTVDDSLDTTRVDILPFEVSKPQGDLLSLAQAARDAGRLKEAIVYLFAYLLLKLEKHHWIQLARGKTNRGYLRELRSNAELRKMMEGVVVTFEDAFFGAMEPDHREFDRCWDNLGEFHQIVEGGPTG